MPHPEIDEHQHPTHRYTLTQNSRISPRATTTSMDLLFSLCALPYHKDKTFLHFVPPEFYSEPNFTVIPNKPPIKPSRPDVRMDLVQTKKKRATYAARFSSG